MSELKPCPFCGGKPIFNSCGGSRWVRCPRCGTTSGDRIQGQKSAASAWNRRTPSPAVRALVEACRRAEEEGLLPFDLDALAAVEREIGEASNE